MRHSHRYPVVAMAVLALAACQKPDAEKADTAAAAAPVGPVTMPRLKAGLWKLTMAQGAGGENRMCIDEALQQKMSVVGGQQRPGSCSETTATRRPGGGFLFRSVCTPGGANSGMGVSRTEGEVTGDFQTRYATVATVTTEGASMASMNGTTTISSEATYMGPCPAGMKSGDLEMAGGMRVNVAEMAEAMAAAQPAR